MTDVVLPRSRSAQEPYSYRTDATVPAFPDDKPIIIFDGHCVLCSGFARFVLKHDKRATIRLMAGQSPLGQALYRHLGLDSTDFQTNILLCRGRAWFKSRGTIRMFQLLGFPWSASVLLRIIPTPLLDRLYSWIARNRLRWFGRQDQCFVADPAQRDRFLG
ncbi:MAG TPA: DCC1-like thiol-disulfide oxidoreductase family protein [Steroidobacteraceae bacterium]|jgi:predicted DCC family thiol-disulfide oxidoreductase YuxK